MNKEIRSGKDILDEFFCEIGGNEELDQETVVKIVELYDEGKLTDKMLTNALSGLRVAKDNG